MKLIAKPLDCSSSLQLRSFESLITTFDYNAKGNEIEIIQSYDSIFTHTQKNECILTGCFIMKAGSCDTSLKNQSDITMSESPKYGLKAR